MFAKNKLRRYENGTCWIVLDFFAFFCKQFAHFFTKFFAGEATYLFCNKIPKKNDLHTLQTKSINIYWYLFKSDIEFQPTKLPYT
jgi:hypothetical protein